MTQPKRVQAQRWEYTAWFSGNRFLFTSIDATHREVVEYLDQKLGWDNWQRESLRVGKRVKVKREQIVKVERE